MTLLDKRALLAFSLTDSNLSHIPELQSKPARAYNDFMRRYEILARSEMLQLQRETAHRQQLSLEIQQRQAEQQVMILWEMGIMATMRSASDSSKGPEASHHTVEGEASPAVGDGNGILEPNGEES